MPLMSIYNLIALVITFNVMLNKSGKSRHPCLVPDLRGKCDVDSRFLVDILCPFEEVPFYSWLAESLYENGGWILPYTFYTCIEMIYGFSFFLLIW